MKEMNLVAQMPHKDAYKHQASHNHVCAAPPNAVNQVEILRRYGEGMRMRRQLRDVKPAKGSGKKNALWIH